MLIRFVCVHQVVQRNDVWTGGVYQVRQGQQRRLAVRVRPAHNSGTLPLVCQQIVSVEVGSVSVRSAGHLHQVTRLHQSYKHLSAQV